MRSLLRFAVLAVFSAAVSAQPAATMRLRGSIEKVDATSVVIKERNGETMTLVLADNLAVNEVLPIDPAAIQSGKFDGTAAMPGTDGTLAALEVLVFPEAMRGASEALCPPGFGVGDGAGALDWASSPITFSTNSLAASLASAAGKYTLIVTQAVSITAATGKPIQRRMFVSF